MAKQIKQGEDARKGSFAQVSTSWPTPLKSPWAPKGPQCCAEQEVRQPAHHQ